MPFLFVAILLYNFTSITWASILSWHW